jgi:hypothetical protein
MKLHATHATSYVIRYNVTPFARYPRVGFIVTIWKIT